MANYIDRDSKRIEYHISNVHDPGLQSGGRLHKHIGEDETHMVIEYTIRHHLKFG